MITLKRSTWVCAFLGIYLVSAQSLGQVASKNTPALTMQGAAEPAGSTIVRDALGRPCLDVEAAARAHSVNRDMVDHVVSVKNDCPKTVKIKICYYNSNRCNAFDLQGYKRIDTILGTMSKITIFRYSLSQK